MVSVREGRADPERRTQMAKDASKIRELEKEMKSLQDEITIYRTYFRVCAENEADPQKKRFYERLANAEDLESLSGDALKS